MPNGILPIDKPSGIGSFDVIRAIKRMLPQEWKREKIGHGGTLDSLASGVLLILFGEATKAFDFLLESGKTYRAVIQLGDFTDTDDSDGKIIQSFDKRVSRQDIENVLPRFRGRIEQLPPKYSAIRVDGKRSYDLARENIEVELKPRQVEIFENVLEEFDPDKQVLTLRITCSSGTYIRSIARDIGSILGCGGYITGLRRTKSAGIDVGDCVALEGLDADKISGSLIPVGEALTIPRLDWTQEKEYIRNGKIIRDSLFTKPPDSDGKFKIMQNGLLLAVVERQRGNYRYLRVFSDA